MASAVADGLLQRAGVRSEGQGCRAAQWCCHAVGEASHCCSLTGGLGVDAGADMCEAQVPVGTPFVTSSLTGLVSAQHPLKEPAGPDQTVNGDPSKDLISRIKFYPPRN